MKTTIKDVAREAGVSVSTVSYVLSRKGEAVKDSHKRVLKAVEKLGYVPSATARSLVHRRTNCIGVIVPGAYVAGEDRRSPFYSWAIAVFAAELSKQGCGMNLYMLDSNQPAGLETFVTSANVDGFVWFGLTESALCISMAERCAVPHVGVYASPPSDNSYVILEDTGSAALALNHLIGLGHRKILCLGGDSTRDLRAETCRAMLRQMGFAYERELRASDDENSACAAIDRYIDSGDELPTAIFATTDHMALGALRALNARGIRVPEDMSVIGYEGVFSTWYSNPPLTAVRQNVAEAARMAAAYILTWRDRHEPGPGLKVHIPPELVVRKSTAAPGKGKFPRR